MAHRVQNFDALTTNPLRTDALSIAEAGYAAINVGEALRRKLRIENGELHINDAVYPLAGRKVFFVGVGKCALEAAGAIEELLGEHLTDGIAFDVSVRDNLSLSKIETHIGTHPLPSEVNVQASRRILEFLSGREASDLVIMLVSGGGSALLCLHESPMTCTDESLLWSELTKRGATIQDINTIRKHTSQARGGALAFAAYPAEVMSLIVSDVPGNDIEYIASGPTVLDTTTVADARAVLEKYTLAAATNVQLIETPKEAKYFERVTNILFLTNQDALGAMKDEAAARGYTAQIVDDRFTGEASVLGRAIVEKLHGSEAKTALLYAGESTVTLGTHRGEGGRSQEMALAALEDIRDNEIMIPFASDGRDNTDHAGAIADGVTRAHAHAKNVSAGGYLHDHRSYDFFRVTDDALVTGYTGSNVSDLIVALKK